LLNTFLLMHYINLHTHHIENNNSVIAIVNQYPLEFDSSVAYYSIGIHPWRIDVDTVDEELKIIRNHLKQKSCLAIGECGIDKRIDTDVELQKKVFEQHLILAQKFNKPVIVHCVAGFDELIFLKNKNKITVPIVIHGFSKNITLANQLINHGFYLSFGKYLLRNPELADVFRSIPNHRFFLETDTIEESIDEVYQKAATIKNIEIEQLKRIVNTNFDFVFTQ
jgi:TatD DNase family protein